MRHRAGVGALLLAGGLLALGNGVATALPAGVTNVGVTAGATTTGIDAHLHQAASISGTVTSVAGGTGVFAVVGAYSGGSLVASDVSDGSGNYTIVGLAAKRYAICINGGSAGGGGSTTGYLGRCYKAAPFNGATVPRTATRVVPTDGQQVTGINIKLPSAAAVAGKVSSGSGAAVRSATVFAHNRSTGATFAGLTAGTGTYTITGLTASANGYTVCVNPAHSPTGTTGFRPRCYKSTAWNGGAFPAGATKVPVALGTTRKAVNVTLTPGGAITGTLTDAANGKPLAARSVLVFSSAGTFLASAKTNAQGRYRVKGLAAATGDRVCAAPFRSQTSPGVSYKGKCWKNAAWTSGKPPSSASPVSVKIGKTHTGINLKLGKTVRKLGSIAGTITEKAGAQPLQGASVTLFTAAGAEVAAATTDASGHYSVPNLVASATGYVVCASAGSVVNPTPPATGWGPRCYQDVRWNGSASPPAGVLQVPLAAGQNRTGINIALRVGGAISGTVTDADTLNPVASVMALLYTHNGKFITSAPTDPSGNYTISGLTPASSTATSGYVVCWVDPHQTPPTYRPQCYADQPWNGVA